MTESEYVEPYKAGDNDAGKAPAANDQPGPTGPVWETAKREPNWLLFLLRTGKTPGKLAKIPTLDGTHAVAADRAALTFQEAKSQADAFNMLVDADPGQAGTCILGYYPRVGSAMRGFDLDDCIKSDGSVVPQVEEILELGESYAEISPSGTGIRIWVASIGDGSDDRKFEANGFGASGADSGGYTFTGRHYPGSPRDIGQAPGTRRMVLAGYGAGSGPEKASGGAWDGSVEEVDADDVGRRLRAALDASGLLQRRWNGDKTGLGDQSRSAHDFSVVSLLSKHGFTFSEILFLFNDVYEHDSQIVDELREGKDRQLRRAYERSRPPTAEEEFTPVELASDHGTTGAPGGAQIWIEHNERSEPDLDEFWRVDDILPFEGIGVVYGPPGCGKTFLCLDMAFCVSLGRAWMGSDTERCPVVYVVSEGGRRAARNRIVGWQRENRVNDTSDFECVASNFDLSANVDNFLATIRNRGVFPGLIVIDTLSQNIGAGHESDTSDMNRFVAGVKRIQRELSCFVLIVHHTGKDESRGARGSTALLGAVDFEASVKSAGNGAGNVFEVTKSREGPSGAKVGFSLKMVTLGTNPKGKPATTMVAISDGAVLGTANRRVAMQKSSPFQKHALAILEQHESLCGDFPDSKRWTIEDWTREALKTMPTETPPMINPKNARASLSGLLERLTPPVRQLDDGTVAPVFSQGGPVEKFARP